MPDPKKPKIDKRSPTPHPTGIEDDEMDKVMKSMEETRKKIQGTPPTSQPLTMKNALEMQENSGSGATDVRNALRVAAAKRAKARGDIV